MLFPNQNYESDLSFVDIAKPKFDSRSRLFELDACDGYGKIILAYKDTKPGWMHYSLFNFDLFNKNFAGDSHKDKCLSNTGTTAWRYHMRYLPAISCFFEEIPVDIRAIF